MTAVEFHRMTRGADGHHTHGWIASLLCHGLGAGCALLLLAEIDKPVLPKPFVWEVAMTEAPAPVEPAPVEPAPAPPVRQPVKRVVESQPLVTPVEPIQEPAPVQQEVHEPMAEQLVQAIAPSVIDRSESIQTQEAVAEPATPTSESLSSTIEHRVIHHRLVRFRQAEADYGWLRDTLRSRIEELKRYPPEARSNHWEGKVVVQAVIRADGTVADLSVAESSGRAVLDQEALAVMRKASPLVLKHPLGKSQVTILVPISYRLDG